MAIRNFLRHFFCHPKGKTSIRIAVPQVNRHPQFSQRKSPRLSKQLRIRQHAFGRRFPSAALTLESSLKSQFVTQRIVIITMKKFQESAATAPRRPERKKRARRTKSETAYRNG